MYTSFQRLLVSVCGGKLYTLKLKFIIKEPIKEGELQLTLKPKNNNYAIVIGSVTVDDGFGDVSFKCKVGKYQYCRHDPVSWSELREPIEVNAVVEPWTEGRVYIWTPDNAELPAYLQLTLWLADVSYPELVQVLKQALSMSAIPVAQL